MRMTGLMIITSAQLISGTALIICDSHLFAMQIRMWSPLTKHCMVFMVLVSSTNAAILMVCVIGFLSGKMESYGEPVIQNQTKILFCTSISPNR